MSSKYSLFAVHSDASYLSAQVSFPTICMLNNQPGHAWIVFGLQLCEASNCVTFNVWLVKYETTESDNQWNRLQKRTKNKRILYAKADLVVLSPNENLYGLVDIHR